MIVAQDRTESAICKPEYISTKHWEEWVNSGVKPSIIAANIYTELDARELDKALNRNTHRKWKHSDKLVPAWLVHGVNPLTGEREWLGIQAKPDNPEIKNGKTQKYIGTWDYGAAPLFLKVDDFDYWLKVIQDLGIPIIITEGAKKAACLLSNGYACISIPGVSACRKKGKLHKLINQFCGFGRTFYLCFDNDVITKRPVQLALEGLARDLSATGSKVMVISLPEGDAKGVDDYIVTNSVEAFEKLVTHAQTIEEWKEDNDLSWSAKQEQIKNRKKSKLARAVETIQTAWGGFLRWNELSQLPELGFEQLEADELRIKIALELDMDVSKDDSVTAIRALSKQHRYHPIREYLQDVAESYHDVDLTIIDNLATELFGNDSQICNIYMKRFLIGSVARMMRPGTKMDNAVILHGAEGIKKSTFWSALFGEDWFSDSIDDSNAKDEKMLIHEYWCLEWSEFATVYKHKDIESLKKFLAQRNDSFRKPYERTISKHKRGCVFVGTTNNPEILQDPSGRNRRFWIINVNQEINIAKLEAIRDQLWAAAYYCWKKGDIHYIAEYSDEAKLQDKENEQFKAVHPWQEFIESFLINKIQTYKEEIFEALGIEPGRREARHERTIDQCLKILGWESTKERGYAANGYRPRLWKKIIAEKNINFEGGVDRNAQDNDIPKKTFDPPFDPPLDLKNNNNYSKPVVTVDPPNDPPFDPPKTGVDRKNEGQVTNFDPPFDPPLDPDRGVDRWVDRKISGRGKGFGHFDPPPPKKVENKKEEKKELIELHPSFDQNQNNLLKISGITGKWEVSYQRGQTHIHIKYLSPDKKKGRQSEFIQVRERLTYTHFREKVEGAIWELERGLVGDRLFRVEVMSNDMNELKPKLIEGCTLVSVPDVPDRTYFTFASPTGRVITKFGLNEFELMER
ncbi:VapE domain-containing protein [Calothrix sp. CCY 0018]|uniref:VapE domain-containing protein n=1 Tax=Calothrix sp. CCY 0018 TaxID=3103864 RepID=UPI0039C71AA1